jgi:endonuclease III
LAAKRLRAGKILKRLGSAYPESKISLDYSTPFQLLVAVILSAQCTDARVNIVTRTLFARLKAPADFRRVGQKELERLIHSTGFYRSKARHLRAAAQIIEERHGGQVPETMEELTALPGVARKTANVVLHHAFGKREGVAVDTHVHRISRLLRLTSKDTPQGIEKDLVKLFPPESWGHATHLFIDHGRAVCIARRPQCARCVLNDLCPSATASRSR